MRISTTRITLPLVIIAVFCCPDTSCLRLHKINVPAYKIKGDKAVLECMYELESDSLYAVKWYKENEEFYRYVPKSYPPQVSYKVEGIKVDNTESNSRKVVLKSVTLKTTGLYRCEVSAEAPSFSSAQKEGYLEVVVLPHNGPHITGERKQYQVGDELSLNCSSGKSYPASLLKWYINENEAFPNLLRQYSPQNHASGLLSTVLGLHMRLTSDHFVEGNLRVRCVATLSPLLWQSNKESVLQKVDNREAMLLVKSAGINLLPTIYLISLLVPLAFFLNKNRKSAFLICFVYVIIIKS